MTRARELADLLTGGQTIETDDNSVQLTLKSTDADAVEGPTLDLRRDSASPAASDNIGLIRFLGEDSAGNNTVYAEVHGQIENPANGSEDAAINFEIVKGSGRDNSFKIGADEVVVNEASRDVDFRVESDGDANMLFVDAANDAIGIGTSSPLSSSKLHIFEAARNGGYAINGSRDSLVIEDSQHAGMSICGGAGNGGTASIAFPNGSNNIDGLINYDLDSRFLSFHSAAGERFRLDSSGHLNFACTTISPGLGNTDTGTAIRADNIIATSSASGYVSINRNGDGTRIQFNNSGNTRGTITVTGTTTAYNTSSDYRLKENVNYTWDATSRLKQLKPVRFNFIEDDTNTLLDGFLAHEVSSIVPEAITGEKDAIETWTSDEVNNGDAPDGVSAGANKLDADGNTIPVMQGIDQSKLVPLLVKTIQELEARITALEAA